MTYYVGSARIDENGNVSGGKAGDQTGKEVCTEKFYVHSLGWRIIRAKEASLANSIKAFMLQACDNDLIGYSQSDRLGVIRYGTYTDIPTNCDCSSLVRACVEQSIDKSIPNFSTSTEYTVLMNTGLFTDEGKYKSGMKLYNGDILVTCSKGHTAVVTQGYSRGDDPDPKPARIPVALNMDTRCVEGSIRFISAWVDKGKLKVQVYTDEWLEPLINPKDINDTENGSCGDGTPIKGIRMYLDSPDGLSSIFYNACVNSHFLGWMEDDHEVGGSDDYAGDLRNPIQALNAYIDKAR